MAGGFSRFPPRLQEAIVSRLGWTSLRPVQEMAADAILDGKNTVVLAPTAGGKTEAAVFPVLAKLIGHPPPSVGAIYIAPIKALLNNQEERLGTYTEMVGMRRFVWHGDAREAAKRAFLLEPTELLMTTPESLEVMLLSQRVPVYELFARLQAIIIDEVHAFAGTDRGTHLLSVIERVGARAGSDLQRIGLSATVGNPADILQWLRGSSARAGVVIDPPKKPRRRKIEILLGPTVEKIGRDAARRALGQKSLFFCQSRALAETVAERMRGLGIDVFVHHSSVAFEERQAAEARFHHGTNACIVCTSTLELGIDVGDLDLVFQANAPSTVSSFLQRMGRTGRRDGIPTNTTFLCETGWDALQAVAIVELARDGWVEPVDVLSRCWPVLAHQILAMTLEHGAISAERIWAILALVSDYVGIAKAEFEDLVREMREADYLFETGGLLSFGLRAEREFGRKNFMELYSVFSSPVLFRVRTASGRDVGSLEQAFVENLVEGMTSFLLAGRAWVVEAVLCSEKIVRVREAPKGRKPSWGGFLPQYLGRDLCQRMREILVTDFEPIYGDADASSALAELRDDLGEMLRNSRTALRVTANEAQLWTFAGGRINGSIKMLLQAIWNVKSSADNFVIRCEKGQTDLVREALLAMATFEWWKQEAVAKATLNALPNYRLSKFQNLLPSFAAAEVVSRHLFDLEGSRLLLSESSE
jgi:ATP-dependent Lhr-like helicase